MSNICNCYYCGHADTKRKKDGKIRCKRYSQWVLPEKQEACYTEKFWELVYQIRDKAGLTNG